MADFITLSPAGGCVAAVGAETFVQSIIPHAQWPQIGDEIAFACRTSDTAFLPIRWVIKEFDLDGSAGTANNPDPQDRRLVGTELPTGKRDYAGSGVQLPRMSSGNPRVLWHADIYPAQSGRVPLISPLTGKPIMIRPGRVGTLSIIIPAAVAGQVAAQTVEFGLYTHDGG